MPRSDPPRVAVLGAGPIGLEAALYARLLGLPVTVYESGAVGEHLRRWGHVRLFSPFGDNASAVGRQAILGEAPRHAFPDEGDCITGREHVEVYLEPLARTGPLKDCLRTGVRVLQVGRRGCLKEDLAGDPKRARHPFRLLLRQVKDNRDEVAEADVVLDCTGTYGQHRWMGDGGLPALGEVASEGQIGYGLEDVLGQAKGHYAGKSVLVVGSGYSAATTVCNLGLLAREHGETWVTWLARGPSTQPLRRIPGDPLKERDRLAVRANTHATRGEDNVEFHPQAVVEAVEGGGDKGFQVTTRVAGKPRTWHVERVIANVGYTPDARLYRELQVQECPATLGPAGVAGGISSPGEGRRSSGRAGVRTGEPGFFILGGKSYGRNSDFLLREGFEQVREAFAVITGKPDLDLTRKR